MPSARQSPCHMPSMTSSALPIAPAGKRSVDAVGAKADLDPAGADGDLLDQKLHDPPLLLGQQDVPDRVDRPKGLAHAVRVHGPGRRGLRLQLGDGTLQRLELVAEPP